MSKITFAELMTDLDPDVIIKNVHIINDLARLKYSFGRITVIDYNDFIKETLKYYKYHLEATRAYKDIPEDIAYKDIEDILKETYGNIANAYHVAESGSDGGLRSIFDAVANHIRAHHENSYIAYILSKVDPTDINHIHSIMNDYIKHYSRFLPDEGNKIDPLMLVMNFKDVIVQHVKAVGRFKKMFRDHGTG